MPGTAAKRAALGAAIALAVLGAGAITASGARSHTQLFHGLNAPGLAAAENRQIGIPPDTTGSVGRTGYLESVNVRLGLFGRADLSRVQTRDGYSFWNRGANKGQVVDPQVAWDDGNRRWYASEDFNGPNDNQLLLAWSKTEDPNLDAGWCSMAIPTGKFFDDFEKLGFDDNHIVIGTNVADPGTRELLYSRLWVIAKPAAGDTTCAKLPFRSFGTKKHPLRGIDGHLAITPIPVVPVAPSGGAFVVAADCPGPPPSKPHEPSCTSADPRSNQITVWRVHGPPDSPRLTRDGAVRIRRYAEPEPVPIPGGRKLDPSDTRLTQAVSAPDPTRGGRLAIWTQHTVAGPRGRSVIRWYELDPNRLTLIRHGTISNRHNWVFNGAISPNADGDGVAIGYNLAGPHVLPQIRARSRELAISNGKFRDALVLGRSAAAPLRKRCVLEKHTCPWGDYAAATADPLHPHVVWGSNELLLSHRHRDRFGDNWGTRNFALRTDR
jgi:hypothetical protein